MGEAGDVANKVSVQARRESLRVYRVTRNGVSGLVECIPETKANVDEFWTTADKELFGDV